MAGISPLSNDPGKLARNSDNWTSHEAANSIDLPKQKTAALWLVYQNPDKTAAELRKIYAGEDVDKMEKSDSIRRRLYELARDGYVETPYVRKCTRSGQNAVVFKITSKGLRALGK